MDALHGRWLNGCSIRLVSVHVVHPYILTVTTQECCEQFCSPGGNTPQSSSCTATYLPSLKLSKLDEPDMLEKRGRAHKWCTPMDPFTLPSKSRRSARTYIQQLSGDTECSPEDLPEAMNNREERRERVRDIHAGGTTRWYMYIYTYI